MTLCIGVAYIVTSKAGEEQVPQKENEVESTQEEVRNPFTGSLLQGEESGESRIACVMVENSADAWPLSGIEDAFFVIEAPVEGAIPRFMACYTESVDVAKIGPVRSARPYYVRWAEGLGAMYAHVGGSPDALQIIQNSKFITDLNEFWNGNAFWRDTARLAPHNAYTSSELLWSAAENKKVSLGKSPQWVYSNKGVWENENICADIAINWGSALAYDVLWECDSENKAYVRKQGGEEVVSSDGDKYLAQNVVIMEVKDMKVVDEVGRREFATEGMGNARVCSLGVCQNALWSKEGIDKPLQFFSTYPSEPIVFSPGTTWVEVVASLENVK